MSKFIRTIKASNIIIDEDLTTENQDKIYNALKRAYNLFDVEVDLNKIFDYVIDNMGTKFYSFEDKGNDFTILIYDSNDSLNAKSLLEEIESQDGNNYHRFLGN